MNVQDARGATAGEWAELKHAACLYRSIAAMATNYADTAREIYYGLTDVKLSDLTPVTLENAEVWSHEWSICDCER